MTSAGRIVAIPKLGGPDHHYEGMAAQRYRAVAITGDQQALTTFSSRVSACTSGRNARTGWPARIRTRSDGAHYLFVLEEAHESEIHVQLLVAMKKAQPGVIGDKIYVHLLIATDHHGVLFDSCGRLAGHLRQLKSMTM